MAATALSASRAKEARQKKIVIGGAALLAIVLVIQGPKLMNQLSSGSGTTSASPPAAPAPVTPGTPTPVASTPVTTPAVGGTDKLVSFETFDSKDPFIQQVSADSGSAASTGSGSGTASAGGATAGKAATEPAGGSLPAAAGFSTSGTPTKPPASPLGASASIMVNGQAQSIDEGKTFPRDDPVFKLVSVSSGSIEIAIADGSLKSGGKTIKVTSGKPVTLKNTTNSKKYRLELISTTTG